MRLKPGGVQNGEMRQSGYEDETKENGLGPSEQRLIIGSEFVCR